MELSKTFFFDSANHLPDYVGKCSEVHGHRWKVEFTVKGTKNLRTGMVVDFKVLKEVADRICLSVDHKDLNTILKNPTAENISELLYQEILDKIPGDVILTQVSVWESPESKVSYS